MIKIDLEWFFEGILEPEKPRLLRLLKPRVAAWVREKYPLLLKRLADDPLSNLSVSQEVLPVEVSERAEPLWLLLAMCVNRTIGSDTSVAVGTSRRFAEVLCESFNEVMEERDRAFVARG